IRRRSRAAGFMLTHATLQFANKSRTNLATDATRICRGRIRTHTGQLARAHAAERDDARADFGVCVAAGGLWTPCHDCFRLDQPASDAEYDSGFRAVFT